MKTQAINTIARSAVLLFALASLSACGSSSKSKSSSDNGGGGPSTSSAGKAQCNEFSASGTGQVAGRATTYYWNGSLVESKLRLRITSIPAIFDSSSTTAIRFYRWKATDKGITSIDQTPLTFTVEKGTNGSQPISGIMSEIDKDDIDALRSSGGVSGSTSLSFFQNTVLILDGTDYEWDALKVVVYDGSSVVAEADFLLPVFAANPNQYAKNHPAVLEQLHPFWADRAEKLSEDAWETRANSSCF